MRFPVCESCPLTCHLHMDPISSFPLPPSAREFPSLCGSRQEVRAPRLLKPVFSVNDRILYVVVSLTGLCSSVFHRTQFNLPICRSGIQRRPKLEGKKITLCVVFSQHSTFGPKQPWRRSIYGFMWMKCAHRVIACWCWLVQGCFVMLGV